MKKTTLINALSLIPEDAHVSVEFNREGYYGDTYKGAITGINMLITDDKIVSVTMQVAECKEAEDPAENNAPF